MKHETDPLFKTSVEWSLIKEKQTKQQISSWRHICSLIFDGYHTYRPTGFNIKCSRSSQYCIFAQCFFLFFKFVFLQSTEFLSEGTNLEITSANEIPTDKSWEIKNIKQNAAARSFTQTEKLMSPLPPYCKKGRESYSNKQYIRYNTFLFLHTWTASCTSITPNISKLFQTCARTLLIVRYTSLFPSKDIQQCQAKLSWMV